MIVSWNWLKQYVALDMSADELVRRLMMSGLNHESTVEVGGDLAIDLEVTSNRPDCLGHIGIAREVAALWNRPLTLPAAHPRAAGPAAAEFVGVEVECPESCPLYIARVVRNVKVGPSPWWLVRRLKTLGQDSVNNVVDITNYVLFECGQPLHVFDLDRLEGRRIVVRNARPGETLDAINHKTYALEPWMCVIADAVKPVALAGVMGGAGSETTETSRNLLIEAADFAPLAVRNASRHLKLRSDSSYRFERRVDSTATDWASRRCCELILDLAGGELAAGAVAVGSPKPPVPPVALRYSQLKRVLGIEVPAEKVREILLGLGAREVGTAPERITVDPPSWRRDLTREIDLIEEVARIHGYEAIPEDVAVPMTAAVRSPRDRVVNTVRQTLSAVGFDECITLSVVEPEVAAAFAPWSSAPPLRAQQPVLRRADTLRQSLIPSLLAARRTNESLGNETIELFEIAKAYLPEAGDLPREPLLVGLASGRDFFAVKGAVEAVAARLNPKLPVVVRDATRPLLHEERCVDLLWGDRVLGLLGEVSQAGQDRFELRKPCTVAELHLDVLLAGANLTPRYEPLSDFPTGSRDLNFVVAETVRWSDLEALARKHGGPHLESVRFRETYRAKQLGDRKSVLFGLVFRSKQGTLVTTEIDAACKAIASAVQAELGGELRAG